MENISTTSELMYAIRELKAAKLAQGQLLEAQLRATLEELRPINLLASTLTELSSMPAFTNSIVGPVAGLATGYLTRKLIVGLSGNVITRVLGTLVQFGVTNFIARHPEKIKILGIHILQRIFQKSKTISTLSDQQGPDINKHWKGKE